MSKDLNQENLTCDIDSNITGCRFSLYPMTNNFADIILAALEKTDISNVWSETDALSTIYRGKSEYVVDAVEALFINAYREEIHMTMEGLISKGCPGDSSGDVKMGIEGKSPNQELIKDKHFPALCKFSLYPMGNDNYMKEIYDIVDRAKDKGLNPKSIHYATRLEGDIQDIFDYFNEITKYLEDRISHYIIHFTISVNSPTVEG